MKLKLALFLLLYATTLFAAGNVLVPNENLVADKIPPIDAKIAEQVRKYSESRTASFQGWHPLLREVLISTRFGETAQIHAVDFPMGMRRQLTFFEDRVGGASYEPNNGSFILFSKDVGGGEWFQYYRLDEESSDIELLTDGESRNIGAVWDKTGTNIAYGSTRRTKKDLDLYVMNPRDKKSDRLLVKFDGGGHSPSDWSFDGKWIAVVESVSINESYVWLVDSQSGAKTLLTPKSETKVSYSSPKFDKDQKGLYWTSDRAGEFKNLAYFDLASKQETPLTMNIPWDVDAFDISKDQSRIAFLVNENGVSKLYMMDVRTKEITPLSNAPMGSISGIKWHPNNKELGFSVTSAKSPSDVFSINVETQELTRWTASETGGLNTETLSSAQVIKWKSFDGLEISGLYYAPPKRFKGKRPVIINIHGGPEAQVRDGFLGSWNYFLNELGVALIFPNVRGSSGFGKSFLLADNGMKRHHSYEDINALFDWIKTNNNLDDKRIMVTGASYGGHMTLAIATHYPEKIRASLPIVAMSNLVTFLENTEAYRRDLRRVEYGDERDPKMREYLLKNAPMTLAGRITKPMFVVHGENDPRVPISEAHQIVKTVRENKVPVWFLIGKDEGHGFQKKKNRDFQFYATIEFVKSYLLN